MYTITFDFASRTENVTPDKPLCNTVRTMNVDTYYSSMAIGNFIDDIDWGDTEQLSSDVALCLAITTVFKPESDRKMVFSWALENRQHLDLARVAEILAQDLETIFYHNDTPWFDFDQDRIAQEMIQTLLTA